MTKVCSFFLAMGSGTCFSLNVSLCPWVLLLFQKPKDRSSVSGRYSHIPYFQSKSLVSPDLEKLRFSSQCVCRWDSGTSEPYDAVITVLQRISCFLPDFCFIIFFLSLCTFCLWSIRIKDDFSLLLLKKNITSRRNEQYFPSLILTLPVSKKGILANIPLSY